MLFYNIIENYFIIFLALRHATRIAIATSCTTRGPSLFVAALFAVIACVAICAAPAT
jgi:hypothetical protein